MAYNEILNFVNFLKFHAVLTKYIKYKFFNIWMQFSCMQKFTKFKRIRDPGGSLDLTAHTSLLPIRRGFAPSFVNYKKGCTWLAAASDKAYQLLAQCRWFSPDSSTTKTGRHDIAKILLKVALKHQKSNQINQ